MSQVKSIFGAYAENLQVVVDNSQDRFRQPWYEKYFRMAPPQTSLTYTSVIGRSRLEAAASVVDRNAMTPERSRQGMEKYNGEIPAIKEKMSLSEDDYRDFLMLQSMSVDDVTKRNQILDFIFNDVKTVGNAAHKRLDIFCLQAISTGKVSLTIDTNPDGLVLSQPLDLLMPTGNRLNVATAWTDPAADIFEDLTQTTNAISDAGKPVGKMLIDRATLRIITKHKSVIDSLISYKALQKGAAIATLDTINEYLDANGLPLFELVDMPIAIEKDGISATFKPFETTNVVFVPNGELGVIKNATAIEELRKVTNVNYASFKRALISKWSENEPFGEWTKVELNAFPAVEAMDSIYLLSRTKAFA